MALKNQSKRIEKLREVKFHLAKNSFSADKLKCGKCNINMKKVNDNKDLFNGALTFHITLFKCEKCGEEYLDLKQAEAYDLFLTMSKIQNKPLKLVSKSLERLTN